ncbi:hypothetical protein AB9G26_09750 [Francisella philomiragia]|uniref:hypothetical protein n=1 Tax=Francisella philomiragia TaxID=28110 RepID=UPI003510DF08
MGIIVPFPDKNELSLWKILLTDGRHMVKIPIANKNFIQGLKKTTEYEKEEPGYYSAQISAILKMQNTQHWNAYKYKELHTLIRTNTSGKANTSLIKNGCQCSYELVDDPISKTVMNEYKENFDEIKKLLGFNKIILDKIKYNSTYVSALQGYYPGQKLRGYKHTTTNTLTDEDSFKLYDAIMTIYNRDIHIIDNFMNITVKRDILLKALAKAIQNLEICHLENDLNTRTIGAFIKIETNKYLNYPCMFYYPSMGGNSTKSQILQELEIGLKNAEYVLKGTSSLIKYNFQNEKREISEGYIQNNMDKYEVNRSLWMREDELKEKDKNINKMKGFYSFSTKPNNRNYKR